MSRSILIVDDSSMLRSQLRGFLETKGVRVTEAENGVEGLWRARESQVDLVVTDVHMPIMDGIRFAQELRKLPEYVATPILVLTSDASSHRAEEGRRAGATAWVVKPVDFGLLWMAVEKLLTSDSDKSTLHQTASDSQKGSAAK